MNKVLPIGCDEFWCEVCGSYTIHDMTSNEELSEGTLTCHVCGEVTYKHKRLKADSA
jgi:transcription elongation factor Elf1